MSSSVATMVGGVVVVTHVHTAPQVVNGQEVPLCLEIQKFSESQPLVLGTIQIMVGIMILLFGIPMVIDPDTIGVYSGIFVWGALCYIAAGSLTVSAGKQLTRPLVKAALAVSIVAAVFSATATILYFLDAARVQGFSGVLGFFNLLQLIVSITIAGYGCSATCTCSVVLPTAVVVPAEVAVMDNAMPNIHQMLRHPGMPEQPIDMKTSPPA